MAPQRTAGAKQHRAAASSSGGPAARTRAATQRQQLAAADVAWPLLLHHDSIRTQLRVACKLLCCSKALAAGVAEHSAGQLDMPQFYAAAEAVQAAPWLRKHARLVRSLHLRFASTAATSACVAALVAAGPQSLMLQSLRVAANSATLPLLEQLPASRLTHLDWIVNKQSLQPQDQLAFVARVSAALARLTALRELQLVRRGGDDAGALSGLSALTQLTALDFYGHLSDMQHAPPQLLELALRWDDDDEQQPLLDLRHLAAVTALDTITVDEGDQLPPNLLRLQIDDYGSVQPLLPLVRLQQLQVTFPDSEMDITPEQLRQLSRLTSLGLSYEDVTEPASAGAWPLLLLQRLELKSVTLSAPVCQRLAQLSALTSLALQSFELPQADSWQQLAAALRQLSGLQHLDLWPGTTSNAEKAAGGRQLVQAIASLQRLRDLRCSDLAALAQAVAGASSLTGLTALTGLSLAFCGLPDAAVTAIVSQLPGLQSLDCSDNNCITDSALPAIGQLQQLTRLDLPRTRVTDAGLQHLAGLTRLKTLDVTAGDAGVTGAGICHHLTGLVRLQKLFVNRDTVSQQQLSLLKQCLPDVRVEWWLAAAQLHARGRRKCGGATHPSSLHRQQQNQHHSSPAKPSIAWFNRRSTRTAAGSTRRTNNLSNAAPTLPKFRRFQSSTNHNQEQLPPAAAN